MWRDAPKRPKNFSALRGQNRVIVAAMSDIEIKIRKLKTGEALVACFESEADAAQWLRERPAYVEVLGSAPSLDPEITERLKEALRPYDDEEKAYIKAEEQRLIEAHRAAVEAEQRQAERDREARREAVRNLGANEPMVLDWSLEGGLVKKEPDDPREITDAVRRAFDAWLEERKSWVAAPKIIVEARVTVWPGAVPSGNEEDRIHEGGRFVADYPRD